MAAIVIIATLGCAKNATDYNAAIAHARENNTQALLYFSDEVCGSCRDFERDAKRQPRLKYTIAQLAFLPLDVDEGDGSLLSAQHSIVDLPTFVLIRGDEKVIRQWSGYHDPFAFLEILNQGMQDPTTDVEKLERLRKTPKLDDALYLATKAESAGDWLSAVLFFREAARIDMRDDYAFDIFRLLVKTRVEYLQGHPVNPDKHPVTVSEIRQAAASAARSRHTTERELLNLPSLLAQLNDVGDARGLQDEFIATVFDRTKSVTDETLVSTRRRLFPDYAISVLGDTTLAAERRFELLERGIKSPPEELYIYSSWCLEHGVKLNQAYDFARRGLEATLDETSRRRFYGLLVDIALALENPQLAHEIAIQAIHEQPDSEYTRYLFEHTRTFLPLADSPG
ncbi:MAG: thioredoxin family protein [bacterium]|nr:thioredoxin family protein [bacterium]